MVSSGYCNRSFSIASIGFSNASRLRGRSLSSAATQSRSSSEWIDRSLPLGRLSGQVAVWIGLLVVGPVSDLSEELVSGCEPVTLDCSVVPECPAGLTDRRA